MLMYALKCFEMILSKPLYPSRSLFYLCLDTPRLCSSWLLSWGILLRGLRQLERTGPLDGSWNEIRTIAFAVRRNALGDPKDCFISTNFSNDTAAAASYFRVEPPLPNLTSCRLLAGLFWFCDFLL